MKRSAVLLVVITLLLCSCGNRRISNTTVAYRSYETECLGVGYDGVQTLRVWSSGRNRADALEQARKKAVYDVAFGGISAGTGNCDSRPVVLDPMAREKNPSYFNKFFSDGGDYKIYVTTAGQSGTTVEYATSDLGDLYGIVVRVDRSGLQARFKTDGIIK